MSDKRLCLASPHEPRVRSSHVGLFCLSVPNGHAVQQSAPEETNKPSQLAG